MQNFRTSLELNTMKINPDLQKERDKATFKPTELTNLLDGGIANTERRKKLENLLYSDPLFQLGNRPYLSRSELYELSLQKSVKLFKLKNELKWTDEEFDLAVRLINHDCAVGIHYTMFIPAIQRLATEEQKAKWLPLAQSFRIIGTYAQTELGHGTNLMKLETTATYDVTTEEFVLNTPKLTSIKWWPGALGKSSNFAIVLAQLVIKGKNYGMHPFMVQLRSLENHMPMSGIRVGDIGPKMGGNNIDNGFLFLDNVRVPRLNMFMKNAQVTKDGRFISKGFSKANYATMVYVRVKIVSWCFDSLSHAATVAIRYSAVRRQSQLQAGVEEESQILDYQTQQYKVFPCLATAYGAFFVSKLMFQRYNTMNVEIQRGNISGIPELHILSSGMKAYFSDLSVHNVDMCRRSLGGHGYLKAAGLAENLNEVTPMVTVEGENTVLYLQIARYLMKKTASAYSGQTVEGSTSYLNKDPSVYTCPVLSEADCRNLSYICDIYKHMAYCVVTGVARRLQTEMERGTEQHIAMNNNLVALVAAAKTHCQVCAVQDYIEGIRSVTVSLELSRILNNLCCFFAVHELIQHKGDFLETQSLNLVQLKWFKDLEVQLLAEIRPDAAVLVDAFDIHDEALFSVIGCYDGNVYERLYKSALNEPLNKTEVHPSYHKYLRQLVTDNTMSKL